jgi:hypothetical protein
VYLALRALGAEQETGFFANVDSPSLEAFWQAWPTICMKSAAATWVYGDTSVATAAMLQASLAAGHHKNSAEQRAMLAQAAIWFFMANHASSAERGLLPRGDVFLQLRMQETTPALFDTSTLSRAFLAKTTPSQRQLRSVLQAKNLPVIAVQIPLTSLDNDIGCSVPAAEKPMGQPDAWRMIRRRPRRGGNRRGNRLPHISGDRNYGVSRQRWRT